mmetsp:Transcript_3576/g.6972  ORF Transcript_3576/g.6972 Transcript_3576/m.6972 type:complete len:717 (-) Transcript_3576:199-2349(-)|eukprot:CAMPEP_0172825548 /NCGR_PEP_ID=MMETSP1075-20121228/18739_1 /TAXON_ID=2916 /ORGANISM="Ceratium fusus, Strain PA161109" /LENGTH=716 /DNA_ID=CAMNT_0013667009 /DNA_START=25 /DNA_END=2175 /DNA_ORIENTATION=-
MINRTNSIHSVTHNFCPSAVGCDLATATLQELEDENYSLRKELDAQRITNGDLTSHIKYLEHELDELRSCNLRLSQSLDRQSVKSSQSGQAEENRAEGRMKTKVKELMKFLDDKDKAHERSSKGFTKELDDLKNQLAKSRLSEQRYVSQLEQAEGLIRTAMDDQANMSANYEELLAKLDIERSSSEQLRVKVQHLEDELEAERMHIRRTNADRPRGTREVHAPRDDECPMTYTHSEYEGHGGFRRSCTDDLSRALAEDPNHCHRQCYQCELLREELSETKSRLLQDCTDLRVRLEASEAVLAKTALNEWGQQALKRSLSIQTVSTDCPTLKSFQSVQSFQSSTDSMDDIHRQNSETGVSTFRGSRLSLKPVAETSQLGALHKKEPIETVKVGDVVAEFLEEDESLKIEIRDVACSGSFSGRACINKKQALNSVVHRLVADLTDLMDDSLKLPDSPQRHEETSQPTLAEPEEELSPPPEKHQPQAADVKEGRVECDALRDLQAECDQIREDRDTLKTVLAGARQLGQEQERSLVQLRQYNVLLERTLAFNGHHVPTAPTEASNPVQGVGATSSLAKLASEQADLVMHNRTLQEQCQSLREELAILGRCSVTARANARGTLPSEVRAKLHVAQLAEVEARRQADVIPGLAAENWTLRKRAAEAEQKLTDMDGEAASNATWFLNKSTFWTSFMSAAPEAKTALRPLPTGANDMTANAGG